MLSNYNIDNSMYAYCLNKQVGCVLLKMELIIIFSSRRDNVKQKLKGSSPLKLLLPKSTNSSDLDVIKVESVSEISGFLTFRHAILFYNIPDKIPLKLDKYLILRAINLLLVCSFKKIHRKYFYPIFFNLNPT